MTRTARRTKDRDAGVVALGTQALNNTLADMRASYHVVQGHDYRGGGRPYGAMGDNLYSTISAAIKTASRRQSRGAG